jgi:hypothetical protein
MKKDILEEFGKDIIEWIRDKTLETMENKLLGKMNDDESQLVYKKIKNMGIENVNLVKEIIMETVEEMTINIFDFFEEYNGKYLIEYYKWDNEEEIINLNELSGGLADKLYGDDGWIRRYSKKLSI